MKELITGENYKNVIQEIDVNFVMQNQNILKIRDVLQNQKLGKIIVIIEYAPGILFIYIYIYIMCRWDIK